MNTKEQFEAWFENDVVGEEVTFPEFDGGEYTEGDLYDDQLYFMLQAMWMAWQSASKASEQQLTESRREFTAANATIQNLELKVAQVVAENAGLKTFGDKLYSMYKGLETSGGGFHDEQSIPYQQAALDAAMSAFEEIETPETDAHQAKVRAQGVEMVIAYHRERADALHHVDRSNAIRHSMAALDASDVAAQLRQESAQ